MPGQSCGTSYLYSFLGLARYMRAQLIQLPEISSIDDGNLV